MTEKSKTEQSQPTPPDFPNFDETYATESGVPVHMVQWRPWDDIVPKQFLEALVKEFPLRGADDLRLLLSLAVTAKVNQPEQRIIFPRLAIAECIDLPVDRCRNENAARSRLSNFLERILPSTDILPYSYKQGKATTVAWHEEAVDHEVLRLRNQQSSTAGDLEDAYVYPEWDEGDRVMRSKSKSERLDKRKAELSDWNSEREKVDIQTKLLKYLHDHHGNSFTINKEDYRKAKEIAQDYSETTAEEKRVKGQLLQNLDRVNWDPFPLYHLSEGPNGSVRLNPCQPYGSVRLNPCQPSLASIPKKMRRALKPNWIELDLSHAHLAIAAGEWDLTQVQHALRESHNEGNQSIWRDFYDSTGCEAHGISLAVAKSGFKDALYALLYGASPNNIYEAIKESYQDETSSPTLDLPDSVLAEFGNHWIINRLYEAREQRIAELRDRSVVEDVFGRKLRYDPSQHEDIRSVMSKLAQSVELKLLEPVVNTTSEV
ncbi:hypothetical protein [Salinibacter ruber]|uniref:Uncharacterized protein n=1 Tax=Salinibacter ruber TaxID=146919 RepID=A0A9X2V7Q9_9BACT|nr:hypothetical protein [Salinibacter ruber]MCS4122822.1 hypothetical protein [Salinibacter ruber]